MSHPATQPQFVDNGAGLCWHCGRPEAEHDAHPGLMSAHTPGPWIYGTVTGTPGFQFFVDGDSSLVADVAARPEEEANARLIAAAPELAGAAASAVMRLADFSRYFRNHGDRVLAEILEEVLEAHRAALRKAGRLP